MSCRDLPTRLALRFHGLAEQLQSGGDPAHALDALVALAVEIVPGCDWAGVVQLSGRRRAESIAHSGTSALRADELQVAAGAGPAVDAARLGSAVAVADLADDQRWPQLGPALAEHAGVRSVLSFRLGADPTCSALSLYGRDAGAFAPETLETAALFATHARTHLLHLEAARKARNLADALTTSRTIGSAIGIVMLAQRVTSEQAFELLREASQHLHLKIRDLAEEVTRTGALPPLPPLPRPVRAAQTPGGAQIPAETPTQTATQTRVPAAG